MTLQEAFGRAFKSRPDLKWSFIVSCSIIPGTLIWVDRVGRFGDVALALTLLMAGTFLPLFWLIFLRAEADKYLYGKKQ